MLAGRGPGLVWVTPHCAQQCGVRPNRQRQHGGEDSCSKHGTLNARRGKTRASPRPSHPAKSLTFVAHSCFEFEDLCGISPTVAENPPLELTHRILSGRQYWAWRVASQVLNRSEGLG